MLAFSRITSILFFVLSLSFLACAIPAPVANSNTLTARDQGADLLKICADLEANVQAKIDDIAKINVKTVADVYVNFIDIIESITVATQAIDAVGVKINIDAEVKAQVAAHIAAVIKLTVNLCVTLVSKLGVSVLVAILFKVDACLQLLLANLAIVVHGIVAVIVKLLVDITAEVLTDVQLKLCLAVLLPAGLSL